MSQSPPNYIDGVPVKISENYRPPPIIHLPQPTRNRLERREQPGPDRGYDFTLELSVLAKIGEWRTIRDREESVRRERMLTREQERRRVLEEKQKALLTQVSYPSAEDLSSEDELPGEVAQIERHSTPQGHFSPPTNFDTILMPTVLPGSCHESQTTPKSTFSVPAKINYSDFETDTSSPFDNLELKTINDLDILAQVLKTTVTLEEGTNGDNECAPKTTELPQDRENSNDFYAQSLAKVSYDTISTEVYATPSVPMPQYLNYQPDNYSQSIYPACYGNIINGAYYYGSYGNPMASTYTSTYVQPIPQPAVSQSVPDRFKSKSVPDIANELSSEVQRHSERRRIRNNSQTIASPCDEGELIEQS